MASQQDNDDIAVNVTSHQFYGDEKKRPINRAGGDSDSDQNAVGVDKALGTVEVVDREAQSSDGDPDEIHHPADKDDILRHTIHLEDDPSLPTLTFRTWFIGIGLTIFAGTISAIYYFKPQQILLTTAFLAVLSYMFGEACSLLIPRRGWLGRWLNPHPFNIKEHLAIIIMANSASIGAYGIELLAVEQLYYNRKVNGAIAVFLLFSSQFIGFGLAGLMRKSLVYPKNMLWPYVLPINSMLENLHRPKSETRKQLIVFGIFFGGIFVWEIVPQWIMPILTGVSVFCLAKQNSATFTRVFGGTSGNEGMGLFSLCFDWQYISGGYSPLYFPLDSLINQLIGIAICVTLYMSIWYGNVWDSSNLPFLSQVLFDQPANGSETGQWNQTLVLGPNNKVDPVLLEQQGLPLLAGTYVLNILTSNMIMSAAVVHLFLFHWVDMKGVFTLFTWGDLKHNLDPRNWVKPSGYEELRMEKHYDPHFELMKSYKPCPDWWFGVALILSFVVALICLYTGHSTLPWWGLIVACLVAAVFLLLFGALQALTGITFLIQSIIQLIGGYILPGNPVSNMYFSLYGYNSVLQGCLMAQDLKLAQYGHLAPRVTFSMQFIGAAIGAVFNWIMMNTIVPNKREILLSVEGTNIWSGQQLQQFNTLSVAFGGLAHELFSVGGRYQWCTLSILIGFVVPLPFYFAHRYWPKAGFDLVNTSVLLYYSSFLFVGINSSILSFYIIGFFSQLYLRRYYPTIFVKYNYLVSAALDGGTSVIVFILSFAVFGAAGHAVNFPQYWGNNLNGNFDLCFDIPSSS